MATQTFTLEGQSYTVPHGTSMDELDEYIKGQKKGPDALTQQTQATAKAAGAPSAQYPANIHNNAGETVEHPGAAPIPGTAAIEKQGQRLDLLGRRENRAMRSPTPFSNAVSVYAPVQAAEQVAASKVGGYAGAKVAPHVGLTPEQGELAGGVLGNLGVGAVHGASAVKGRLEVPEKLNLPMGAKYRLKTPNPYEEMGASAQYRDVARDAMKPPAPTTDPVAQAVKARTANWIPTKVTPPGEAPLPMPMQAHAEMEADIAASRLGRAGARHEMYGDLASARNAREAPAQYPFPGAQSSSPAATSNLLPPPVAAGEGPLQVATGPIPRFVTPGTKTPIPEPPSRFAGMASTRPSDVAALPQPEYPAATAPAAPPKVSYVSKFSAPESAATGVESGDLKAAADNLGRTGSAGDLAHWREDDLWQGYLKNKGTPLGEALGNEIKRRGFATSAAEHVRPIPKGKP